MLRITSKPYPRDNDLNAFGDYTQLVLTQHPGEKPVFRLMGPSTELLLTQDQAYQCLVNLFMADAKVVESKPKWPCCRLCGKGPFECGGFLHRVNEKGVKGIWECRPSCSAKMTSDEALIAAIEGSPT